MNLKTIASYLDIDLQTLQAAYDAAPHAELRPTGAIWPDGTGTPEDRRLLYALVVVLQPAHILDIGTSYGASASMLSDGVMHNGAGHVVTVDYRSHIENGQFLAGHWIPDRNLKHIRKVTQDAVEFVKTDVSGYALIVEDTDHTESTTQAIWTGILKTAKPGTVLLSHDANHKGLGKAIVAGIEAAGVTDYVIADTSTGYLVYRVPEVSKPSKTVKTEVKTADEDKVEIKQTAEVGKPARAKAKSK